MRVEQLISIGLATMVTVATVYFWYDRWKGTNSVVQEAFVDMDKAKSDALDTIINNTQEDIKDATNSTGKNYWLYKTNIYKLA